MKKNIVIIYGGKSTEHDISILTAQQVLSAIDTQKYEVVPIYIAQSGKWFTGKKLMDMAAYKDFNEKHFCEVSIMPNSNYLYIKRFGCFRKYKKIDCAILSNHGKNGEDGTLQGLLELSQIPYTSSDVLGSAVGMNKYFMKQIFRQNKIPIVPFKTISKDRFEAKGFDVETLNVKFPVVVKPNTLGSSIGISVCQNYEELFDALKLGFLFDDMVLIERMVENMLEVNISVLGNETWQIVSKTEEIVNQNGLLSFDKKYLSGQNTKQSNKAKQNGGKKMEQSFGRNIPANISKRATKRIEYLAKKVFMATKSSGVVRIDFMIDRNSGKIYVNETNTIPGSFAFYLWEKTGLNFSNLIDKIIELAIERHKNQNLITTTFESSVLKQSNRIK